MLLKDFLAALVDYFVSYKLYTKESEIDIVILPTVLFVRALNLYCFANLRRVNEDNIDINRNFLAEKQFEFVESRDINYALHID